MQNVQLLSRICLFALLFVLAGYSSIFACIPQGSLVSGAESAQLKKDGCHQYEFEAAANSYWEITIEQKGVDVLLRLLENGKEIQNVDSENVNSGVENLVFVAEQNTKYVLEIKWHDDRKRYLKNDGIYKIKVESRQATAEDKRFLESFEVAKTAYNNATSKRQSRSESVIVDYQTAIEIFKSAPERKVFRNKLYLANYLFGFYLNSIQKYKEALAVLEENVTLNLEIPDKNLEALTLREIGAIYLKLGASQKSYDFLLRASFVYEEILKLQLGIRRNVATFYILFADSVDRIGLIEKAINLLEVVRSKYSDITDAYFSASVKLADVWLNIRSQKKAEEILTALVISEDLRPNLKGMYYKVSGKLYSRTDKERALQLFNKALGFYSQSERDQIDVKLFIGQSYFHAKEYQIAKKYYEEVRAFYQNIEDKFNLAQATNNLGLISHLEGDTIKGVPLVEEALYLNIGFQNDVNKAKNLINLMYFHIKLNNEELAVFYGKWAINTIQFIKYEGLQNLEAEVQQNFKDSFNDSFRELANLLIKLGRISEAEQVLRFIKEKEFFDYVRGNSKIKGVDYTEKETELLRKFLTKDEKTSVNFQSDLINKEIVYSSFSTTKTLLKNFEKQRIDVSQMIFVTVLVSKNFVNLIVSSSSGQKVYTQNINREDLNKLVFDFRTSLNSLRKDPRLSGKKLYDVLVKPFEKDLEQNKVTKIIWSLDGALRYVSIPALYDGRKYFVEKYSSAQITFVSDEKIVLPRSSKLTAVGLASSRAFEDLPSLPDAKNELDCIFEDERKLIVNSSCKKGLIRGKKFADEEFTQEIFEESLAKYQLIHLTSHFVLQTGDISQSYLLLGGGNDRKYTMQRFAGQRLNNTEVLVMSACDTANLSFYGDGSEFESFASLAQKQGAKSVVGTLWSVSDSSTSRFMYSFYKFYQIDKLDKSESLRRAQMLMASDKRFSHPFYWAPFIIFGNWQ